MTAPDSRRVVIAALLGNVAIAACKFGAAFLSGSSATLAEAVHSVADTGNQALLLVGMRLAMKPPEANLIFNAEGQGINLCRPSDIRWGEWSRFQTRKRLHDYYSRGTQPGLKQILVYFLFDLLKRFRR